MSRSVPEGRLARAGVAGTTALRLGLNHLGHQIKRPFLADSSGQEARDSLDERNARLIFSALSQLRGTALKAAQMLCMEVDVLPPAWRRELEKSCYRVPPLNRVLVRKVLFDEFGQQPEALFAHFDADAFAAASLGQVHAGVLHDGRRVAVKIQYPGIAATIDSDMSMLRRIALGLPNARLAQSVLDDIHARLREEVDYRVEADNQRWFRARLPPSLVTVPEVHPERCATRVLTSCHASGLHFDEWLRTGPDQSARNRAAQGLYDLFILSALRLGRLHADPNPGNYLFAPDGALTLLDFGCVKDISPAFSATLPRILQGYLDDDSAAVFEAYRAIGMEHGADSERVYTEVMRPFGRWLLEPLRVDRFSFAVHTDYTARGMEVLHGLSRIRNLNRVADEFIYFDRTFYSLCKLFERLGAEVRMRHHWEPMLSPGGQV
ncbi:AarF/ABC1/UbiB kinase family protein [Pseudoduganella sp. FT93W]|uniref:AarF/ABC1/UbiB kinase family protein n=1 Tax=Duganella fentianensis TaxID=2692177 RepID=A0A845HRT3_9BURK|nr:AarF/ABC1/UbiB kinase family protein [Duganella fentianensis]MYN43599.1 AarF/ABC1/UbiB kinase family protein [Duganella fentianensis]